MTENAYYLTASFVHQQTIIQKIAEHWCYKFSSCLMSVQYTGDFAVWMFSIPGNIMSTLVRYHEYTGG